jgi:hypothetical protein
VDEHNDDGSSQRPVLGQHTVHIVCRAHSKVFSPITISRVQTGCGVFTLKAIVLLELIVSYSHTAVV